MSVSHHHESFKTLNMAIQQPSRPHNSSHTLVLSARVNLMQVCLLLMHMHTEKRVKKTPSCPDPVINAITNGVAGSGQGRAPPLIHLPEPWSGLKVKVKFPKWQTQLESTAEQKVLSRAPSVWASCADLGFCRDCRAPDCEWFLLVALAVKVSDDQAVGKSGRSRRNKDHSCLLRGCQQSRVTADDID